MAERLRKYRARPTLSQLRAFLAVLETGSFSEAALDLDMSQAAVSQAVKELEGALGTELFSRRPAVTPTAAGEAVARHARRVFGELEAMAQQVTAQRGLLGGTLRVASFRSAATHLLPGILSEFRQRFPRVEVELLGCAGQRAGVESALLDAEADVGILTLPTADALLAFEIAQDDYVAVLPRGCQVHDPVTVATLTQQPFLLCEEDCGVQVEAYLEARGAGLTRTSRVRDDSVILSMVAHGLGVSVLPKLAVEPTPDGVQVLPLAEPITRRIGLAVHPSKRDHPVVRAFLQSVRKQ